MEVQIEEYMEKLD